MKASCFITFFTYMLRQNAIPFWKELFVVFKMAQNIKKHSLYFSSYRRLYEGLDGGGGSGIHYSLKI